MGREPSGNPFINAGALAVPTLIDFVRRLARAPDIDCNARVAESELATSSRNAAMAYFMKSFGNLHHAVDEVLRVYCHHCAIEMSCVELARAVRFFAHRGICVWSPALEPSGNSHAGSLALEHFTSIGKRSIF